jgi:hypothetical protein
MWFIRRCPPVNMLSMLKWCRVQAWLYMCVAAWKVAALLTLCYPHTTDITSSATTCVRLSASGCVWSAVYQLGVVWGQGRPGPGTTRRTASPCDCQPCKPIHSFIRLPVVRLVKSATTT